MKNIRRLAEEMLDLCDEVESLRNENLRLRAENKAHTEFLYDSVKSGQQQMVNWMDLLMSDAITINKGKAES